MSYLDSKYPQEWRGYLRASFTQNAGANCDEFMNVFLAIVQRLIDTMLPPRVTV